MLLNCGLEKTPESPLDCKEIQPVHPKGDGLSITSIFKCSESFRNFNLSEDTEKHEYALIKKCSGNTNYRAWY